MCCGCGREYHGRHPAYIECHHGEWAGFFPHLMTVEEEVKSLEEYEDALEKRLQEVKERLQALKR
jgi:hypothetical protein